MLEKIKDSFLKKDVSSDLGIVSGFQKNVLSLLEHQEIASQLEQEVKILDINEKEILEKLKLLQAIEKYFGIIYDAKIETSGIFPNFLEFPVDDKGNEYFQKDDKIFFKDENNEFIEVEFGKTFRIRQKGSDFYFTIKSKDLGKNGVKTKVEFSKKSRKFSRFFGKIFKYFGKRKKYFLFRRYFYGKFDKYFYKKLFI